MRIGIDARFYGPNGKGIGRYLEKLIAHLEKLDRENEYFVFLRRENFDLYKPANPRFHKILANYPWYSWQEQILLPFKLKKYHLDLVHFPHFNAPIFYRGKFILTVHDLTLLDWPTKHSGIYCRASERSKKAGLFCFRVIRQMAETTGFNTLYNLFYKIRDSIFRLILRRALKKSEKIITDSEFTKQELIKKFNLPPDKIQVIYLAG